MEDEKKNEVVLRDCCLESIPISSSYWRLEKKEDVSCVLGREEGVARNNKHFYPLVSEWIN